MQLFDPISEIPFYHVQGNDDDANSKNDMIIKMMKLMLKTSTTIVLKL